MLLTQLNTCPRSGARTKDVLKLARFCWRVRCAERRGAARASGVRARLRRGGGGRRGGRRNRYATGWAARAARAPRSPRPHPRDLLPHNLHPHYGLPTRHVMATAVWAVSFFTSLICNVSAYCSLLSRLAGGLAWCAFLYAARWKMKRVFFIIFL